MSIFMSKQLKYFMVAMEKQCIAKAAEQLYLTRTPLCKKLSDLEDSLGAMLFIRKYNELIPTEYALSLHKELQPLYEEHQRIENKIRKCDKEGAITVYIDITIPELIYRHISSSIKSEMPVRKIKFQRLLITEELLEQNIHVSDALFISLRPFSLIYSYRQIMWIGDEVCLLLPKKHQNNVEVINIYVWQDNYLKYLRERINSVLDGKFDMINVISHNLDFAAILYKIYHGNGACILPLKMAMIYKNENLCIQPVTGKNIPVYMHFNNDSNHKDTFEKIKLVLMSLI